MATAPANPFAFPSPDDGRPSDGYGMELRDYFAAKATDADVEDFRTAAQGRDSSYYTNTRAEARYAFADAMLAARKEQVADPTLDLVEALVWILENDDTGPTQFCMHPDGPSQAIGNAVGKFGQRARAALAKATAVQS